MGASSRGETMAADLGAKAYAWSVSRVTGKWQRSGALVFWRFVLLSRFTRPNDPL
jgi:hypothetical protein